MKSEKDVLRKLGDMDKQFWYNKKEKEDALIKWGQRNALLWVLE